MKKNLIEVSGVRTGCVLMTFWLLFSFTACNSQDVNETGEWRQLFNGKDLAGWKNEGPGYVSIEDGLLRGNGGMGLLYWSEEKFGDCVIRVVFKMRDTKTAIQVYLYGFQ